MTEENRELKKDYQKSTEEYKIIFKQDYYSRISAILILLDFEIEDLPSRIQCEEYFKQGLTHIEVVRKIIKERKEKK